MAFFGKMRKELPQGLRKLPNGILSNDRFRSVFTAVGPRGFKRLFVRWIGSFDKSLGGAPDGKSREITAVPAEEEREPQNKSSRATERKYA